MATISKRFIARFGVDNNGQSITNLGVNGASLTRAGAHDLTLTTSASTNITLPTTGTLVTLAGTETLSNKTLDGATLGTGGSNTTTIAGQLSANSSVGSAGQVLTSRGANLSPEWTTVSGGGGGGGTTTNALTIGTGLTGTSFNGSTAVTIAIDTGIVVTLSDTQTLSNKTLTSPDINGGTADSLTSLSVRDTSAAFDVMVGATSSTTLTANRTLTLDVVNGSRTLKLAGNLDLAANFSTATGAITLTGQAGGSSVTLPSTGTVATLDGTETFTNKTLTSPVITGGSIDNTPIGGTTPSTGVFTTATATDFNSTSDARLKKNVVPVKGLEVVNKLNGYEFDFIDTDMHASGVIAQEIEKVLPHIVKDVVDHKTVSYTQLIPYLIESIKELSQEVNTLKNKLGYK